MLVLSPEVFAEKVDQGINNCKEVLLDAPKRHECDVRIDSSQVVVEPTRAEIMEEFADIRANYDTMAMMVTVAIAVFGIIITIMTFMAGLGIKSLISAEKTIKDQATNSIKEIKQSANIAIRDLFDKEIARLEDFYKAENNKLKEQIDAFNSQNGAPVAPSGGNSNTPESRKDGNAFDGS